MLFVCKNHVSYIHLYIQILSCKHDACTQKALCLHAKESLISYKCINKRLVTTRFKSRFINLTIIMCYAPTEDCDCLLKEKFYNQLQKTYQNQSEHDKKIVLGDFNA